MYYWLKYGDYKIHIQLRWIPNMYLDQVFKTVLVTDIGKNLKQLDRFHNKGRT